MNFRSFALLSVLIVGASESGFGRTLMSQSEALAVAFPRGTTVDREAVFLRPQQLTRVRQASGVEIRQELVVRYVGKRDGRVVGYAYFDSHRVRTLPETIMVVVTPAGEIDRIEILSFSEPAEYLPKERWMDQFRNRALDAELSLNRAIRPITGATLTGRAITSASRKVLAIHQVIQSPPPSKAAAAGR